MKRSFIGIALWALSHQAFAWGNWLDEPYDKYAHGAFGAAVTAGMYAGLHRGAKWDKQSSRLTAFGTAVALGVLKEVSDENFDVEDLGATVAGSFIGLGFTFTF